MLKLNQQTVRNMIDRGQLGSVRVGQRRVRVRQSQLDAFLTASETPHETGPSSAADPSDDPWRPVQDAADGVDSAVRAQDRQALQQALSALNEAAGAL